MRDNAFIKLKTLSGDDIFVNGSRVVMVEADEKGSHLLLTDGVRISVPTTMAEIEMLLDVYSYEKGYRRASDVAEEIFAELEVNLHNLARLYLACDLTENFGICDSIYEQAILPVKKKYTDMITKEANDGKAD